MAVLPVPVCAEPSMSFLLMPVEWTEFELGVGVVYPSCSNALQIGIDYI